MSWRNTLILAIVVVVAGTLLYLDTTRWSPKRTEEKAQASRLFPDVTAKDVDAFELRTKDGQDVRVERHDDGWRIVKPIDFPADAMAADGIASNAAEMTSKAVYEKHEALSDYGLDEPPTLRFWTGKKEYALRIGDKSPVGGDTYVTDDGAQKVFAVESYRLTPMQKTLKDLRDARVIVFDRAAVKTIDASWPGAGVSIERKDDAWRLVKPISAEADADTIEALLSNLTFLRADGFVDHPSGDAASLGLAEPAYQVTLGFGKEAKPVTLLVSSKTDGKERLVKGRDGYVYDIAESRFSEFRRSVVSYRFKLLSEFPSTTAARFELIFHPEGAAKPTVLTGTRTDQGWSVTPEPMAPARASRLISEFSRLKAVDVAAESTGPKELTGLGLSPARAEIRIYAKGADEKKPLADVKFGEPGDAHGIPAMRADSKTVFLMDPDLARHVPMSLASYRKIFAAKEPKPAPSAPKAGSPPAATPAPAPPSGN
jgi:hypothetical protein